MKNIFIFYAVLLLLCLNSTAKAQQITLPAGLSYSKDVTLNPFTGKDPVYSLDVTGSVVLNSDSSLCRIILTDDNNREYLVFEAYPILSGLGSHPFSNISEETKYLDGIIPSRITVQLIDASCMLNSIMTDKTSKDGIATLQGTYINGVNLEKVKQINNQIRLNGMIWSAWLTPTGSLSYEKKKQLYGDRYNTRGFEYYKDGFFQSTLGIKPSSPATSAIVSNWDWRSRHHANNPLMPNGNANTCYYDNDPSGSGWMTPPRYQNGCWLNNQFQVILDPECTNLGGEYRGVPTCWSFSPCNVTEGIENLYFNKHIDSHLSEQDVIMCGGWGYYGGMEYWTLGYLQNHGVVDYDCFPYYATPTPCSSKCTNPADVTHITGYNSAGTMNADQIKTMLIADGPITCRPPWSHTYCLTGYDIIKEGDYIDQLGNVPVPAGSPYIGQTYWICKNSAMEVGYGTNHQAYSYTLDLPLPPFYNVVLPVISTAHPESEKRILDCDGDGYYNWGIGPKPANCPPGTPDEEDCDDTDPRLRGQDPVTHECMINCPGFVWVDAPETIQASTTWYYDQIKDHNVIVPQGVTLTVKSRIRFVDQARLIVQPGGCLVVDGGTLTSACGAYWQGVEAWGNPSLSQTTFNQGVVSVINSGIIENAVIGVLSGKRSCQGCSTFDDSQTGGIVHGNSAVFRNNQVAILFRPYTQFSSNPTFTTCDFLTTPDMIDINLFDSFINVSDINTVTAIGCNFINTFSSDPAGTGIYAAGAGVTVCAWCSVTTISPCPEQDLVHTTFVNLNRGIYALNTTGSRLAYVSRTDFHAVQRGLYLSAYITPLLVLNSFDIPEPLGILPYPGPYGMYLDHCNLYHVEGNTFQSTAPTPTTIGLVVNNSGQDANVIYRNTFIDLKYNTIAQDVNRNAATTAGLCYVCNRFKTPTATPTYNTAAIAVTHTGSYNATFGIARYQNAIFGGMTIPTFNLFYNATAPPVPQYYDIYNNCYMIDNYLYPTNYNSFNGYTYRPWNHSANVTIYPTPVAYNNQCPSTIDNGGTQSQLKPVPGGKDPEEGAGRVMPDSLAATFRHTNTPDSYYDLAFLYLQLNQTEKANVIVKDVPVRFSLTPDEQAVYQSFRSLFDLIMEIRSSSSSAFNLNESQTAILIRTSEKCHNRLGAYARNLLIQAGKISYLEPVVLPVFDKASPEGTGDDGTIPSAHDRLKVHPNPASAYLAVEYDLSPSAGLPGALKVFSSSGNMVADQQLATDNGNLILNTENWASGIYLVTIEADGKMVASEKISIMK